MKNNEFSWQERTGGSAPTRAEILFHVLQQGSVPPWGVAGCPRLSCSVVRSAGECP